ncbi:hypothetical protein [Roseateles oligotrophus]|uniref:Uncharacterized protein n=1 Tax=Roseateles oligotrophus TaxID=1769250 RepID=A0ABT2YAI1_9BURK|nr:hypothetical protein [Roseateles oligotrophus]MCV2367054.1 hypothetical protein [Roseateles oligotrophus]
MITRPSSKQALNWAGQALLYGLFALLIGLFSRWPPYRHLAADQSLIKLSFSHHGQPVAPCRLLSAAELAKLPPNMRTPKVCPRERVPVTVELELDGKTVLRHIAPPAGLSKDGASSAYHRIQVAAGEHLLKVRLKDSPAGPGKTDFDYQREARVTLAPGRILVIDFDVEKGGIVLQ